MSLIHAALLLMGANRQVPNLTLSCSGARLSVAVQAIASAAGRPLEVSPAIGDSEIVAFRFKDLPIDEALKRVADAVDGAWDIQGGKQTLVADTAKRAAQAAANRAKRLQDLKKQLAETITPPKPPKAEKKDAGTEQIEVPDYESSSSDKAIALMLQTVDLNLLVDLPEQGRIVFSPTPNRMQRPMRVNAAWLKEMIDEHNQNVEMTKQAKKDAGAEVLDEQQAKWQAYMKRIGMDRERDEVTVDGPPAKILLVVESGAYMGDGSLQTTLKLYDAKGKTTMTASSNLFLGSTYAMMRGMSEAVDPAKPKQEPAPDPKSPKLEWSPLAKDFETYAAKMEASVMAGGSAELPESVKNAVFHPDLVEPLSIFVGEGLVHSAELTNKQMVASLPDSAFNFGGQLNLPSTVARFLAGLKAMQTVVSTETGEWLTVTPKDPFAERKNRMNRAAIASLLGSVGSATTVPLETLAKFAAKTEYPFKSEVSSGYLFIGAPSLMRYMFDARQWEVLRFYGQLEPAQRSFLNDGRRIALGALASAASQAVSRLVFGANPNITIGNPEPPEELGGLFGLMAFSMPGGGNESDYREEPTELCPNGLPAEGYVSATIKNEVLLKAAKGGGFMEMMGNSGLNEFAMYQLMRENPAMAEAGAAFPPIKDVFIGSRRNLNLNFQLSADASIRRDLTDDAIPADAKPVSLQNLPPEVKAALDRAVANLKKMDLPFMDPSMFGGGRPPIPPK